MQAIKISVLSSLSLSAFSISFEPANFFLPSTPFIAVFSMGEYKSTPEIASLIFYAQRVFLKKSPS
jgi:hypothetical protein